MRSGLYSKYAESNVIIASRLCSYNNTQICCLLTALYVETIPWPLFQKGMVNVKLKTAVGYFQLMFVNIFLKASQCRLNHREKKKETMRKGQEKSKGQ